MLTDKLRQAKEFLGEKWCLHPQYKRQKPTNNYQSRVLKPVLVTARRAGRI